MHETYKVEDCHDHQHQVERSIQTITTVATYRGHLSHRSCRGRYTALQLLLRAHLVGLVMAADLLLCAGVQNLLALVKL